MISSLWLDIRYSFRTLLKNPGFALAAVLVLGLGISGTTTVFSAIDGALLRPFPYREPERLLILHENNLRGGLDNMAVSLPDFQDWRAEAQVFEGMAAYDTMDLNLAIGEQTQIASGAVVSPSLFDVLGVEVAQGRTFSEEEARTGARVAVISDGLRRRLLGPDTAAVGTALRLDSEIYTVVGVTPAGFTFPTEAELWTPLAADAGAERSNHYLYVVARLKPGATLQEARAEMDTMASRLARQYPETNANTGVVVKTLRDHFMGEARPILWILLATVGFVLLIACSNVANLLLARAVARRREVALRVALGGGRSRLVRQFLTESFVLSLLGGALGVVLARWEIAAILETIPIDLPLWLDIRIDRRVLAFALVVSAMTAVICGLAPALRFSQPNLNHALKEGGGVPQQRLRALLVIGQMAFSLVLLIGAGLMITSLLRLQGVRPGFDPSHVLAVEIAPLPKAAYPEPAQMVAFYQQVLARAGALPNVESVGLGSQVPLWRRGGSEVGFRVEGRPPRSSEDEPVYANYQLVSADYFRTLGIPPIQGRVFGPQDGPDSTPVMIVNRKMASRIWPGESPIGKRIQIDGKEPWIQVVGVVGDVRHRGLGEDVLLDIYVPYSQRPRRQMTLVLRSSSNPEALASAVRGALRSVDAQQPIANMMSMREVMTKSLWLERFGAHLVFVFAVIALLLAAVGLYGTLSYLVNQRTHDIGIRMALGAHGGSVLRMVLRQSLKLVLIGLGIGLPLSVLLNRALSSLLYGIGALEPSLIVGITLLLVLVALLAGAVPARRATRVDPVIALRYE